jgi:hypothetical protein
VARATAYGRIMPRYRIHMINSEFESCEEGEYSSIEAAKQSAIASGVRVATEAVARGEATAAVEIRIEEDGEIVLHHVVNLSVSKLLPKA